MGLEVDLVRGKRELQLAHGGGVNRDHLTNLGGRPQETGPLSLIEDEEPASARGDQKSGLSKCAGFFLEQRARGEDHRLTVLNAGPQRDQGNTRPVATLFVLLDEPAVTQRRKKSVSRRFRPAERLGELRHAQGRSRRVELEEHIDRLVDGGQRCLHGLPLLLNVPGFHYSEYSTI